MALLHWAATRIDDAEREAAVAVAALEALPPGSELAMAYATLARLRGTTLDDEQAIAWGERAIALAESLGATETLVDALITVGAAKLAAGDEVGREQLERSITLATAAGLDDLTARAHANLGFGYSDHFRFAHAARYFAAGIAFCSERDLDYFRQHLTAWLAHCRLYLGEWDEAADLAGSVLAAPNVAPVTRFAALLVAALVRVRRGEPHARSLLDEGLALAVGSGTLQRLGPIRAARAEAVCLKGDHRQTAAEALAVYDLAIERNKRWFAGELAYWRWCAGDLVVPPSIAAAPFALQIAGDWAAAAAAWDELACPYEAARARAESDNPMVLRQALATFEQLRARPAATLVRRRLRLAGAAMVPRGPRPSTWANSAHLTRRQLEIVRLLVHGHSNQQIADHLFLSPRTIENHVASILSKLGVASRADAAREAIRLGLVTPN
jgi:DNA-binding CsgD family transcriptional regulator